MWEKLIVILLLSASLTGCLDLQTGEEVSPLNQEADDPASNTTGTQAGSDDSQGPAEDGTNTTGTESGREDTAEPGEDKNGTTQADQGTEDQATDEVEGAPAPWTREGKLELGWLVAAGANTSDPAPGTGPQGQTDAEHCPTAHLIVPQGTGNLTLTTTAEPVNARAPDDPANATPPGFGLYDVLIRTAGGEELRLEGAQAAGDDATLRHQAADPSPGQWTIEMRPVGPVLQQTWQVDVQLSGQAASPPGALTYVTAC